MAKAGYGTACEAMVAGTPMLYPPRTGFAEYRALDRALRAWGGGIPLSARDFAEMRLERPLERAFALKPGPPPFPADGAARVAERLTQTCLSTPTGQRPMRSTSRSQTESRSIDEVRHPPGDRARAPGRARRPRRRRPSGSTRPTPTRRSPRCRGPTPSWARSRPKLLARADRLRWVQAFTASLEHYLFPALIAHPCTLTNMRGLFSDVIADQVMGYILCFARNLHTYVRRQVEHRYEPRRRRVGAGQLRDRPGRGQRHGPRDDLPPRRRRSGSSASAPSASEIARRALAFGMTVRAVDRHPERTAVPDGVALGRGDRPARRACSPPATSSSSPRPQTPETIGLFNAATLAHLRPTSYLINIGRGAIVVLDDLVAALRAGRLAGAALDVFEVEPLPADHPLWDFPNVIITPHTAGYAPVIAARHLATLVENVRRFVRGEPLTNVVDKNLWY